ncbi:MAG: porin [Pseudomonadales bacterium]
MTFDGGEGDTVTLGVNWYARSNVKAALNYIHARTDNEIGAEGSGDAVALRLQYLF